MSRWRWKWHLASFRKMKMTLWENAEDEDQLPKSSSKTSSKMSFLFLTLRHPHFLNHLMLSFSGCVFGSNAFAVASKIALFTLVAVHGPEFRNHGLHQWFAVFKWILERNPANNAHTVTWLRGILSWSRQSWHFLKWKKWKWCSIDHVIKQWWLLVRWVQCHCQTTMQWKPTICQCPCQQGHQ